MRPMRFLRTTGIDLLERASLSADEKFLRRYGNFCGATSRYHIILAPGAASQPNRGPRGSIRVITGFNRLVADTPGTRLFLIQWLKFWCWCRSRLTISI